jgi:hypothetical protein
MTDDEILQLVDTECPSREYVRIMTNQDLIDFAEAVVNRTLTNQKAKWYQEGVEAERRACAKLLEDRAKFFGDNDKRADTPLYRREYQTMIDCADEIRARGK